MYESLLSSSKPTDIIITGSRRLATYLQNQYSDLHIQAGRKVWEPLQILPIQTWLQNLWETLTLRNQVKPLLLLNDSQELVLWETLIADSIQNVSFLNLSGTTELARKAWRLCKEWQIDIHDHAFTASEDTALWQKAAIAFENKCHENQWLDNSSLLDWITEAILKNSVTWLPQKIYLAGFDEMTLQQKQLFETLKLKRSLDERSEIQVISIMQKSEDTKTIEITHRNIELEAMAKWAFQTLQNNPQIKIGCIIPKLSSIRNEVCKTFQSIFAPQNILSGEDSLLPFNISGGDRLNQFCIIKTAFHLLELHEIADTQLVSELLCSPYFGDFQEKNKYAQIDARLRKNGEYKVLLRKLIAEAKNFGVTKLEHLIEDFLNFLKSRPQSLYPSEWIFYFEKQLNVISWPGTRVLNSLEYQLVNRFYGLLFEFKSLDTVLGKIDFNKALYYLKTMASQIIFQPETKPSSVEILGILEATGLEFDAIWVLNCDDETWPTAAKPNPFIPLEVQRKKSIPHSSQDRETYFAKLITDRLTCSAEKIIFSYAKEDDEKPLRCSPLLNQYPKESLESLHLHHITSLSELLFKSQSLENYSDWQAPAIQDNEPIKGGSAIFQQQAACPFRAFTQFRLQAQKLESIELGLNARERGTLIHTVLENIWNELKSQENLIQLSEIELINLIQINVDNALSKLIQRKPFSLKPNFVEIEKKRLQKIILKWLDLEKNRPPFDVVSIEQEQTASLAGIPLKLRVDRVDQINENKYLIIDYKTGEVAKSEWFSDRPDEPQMPLYAVISNHPVDALAFAQLKPNQIKFEGVSADYFEIPGITPISKYNKTSMNWDQLIKHWKNTLENLGGQFKKGDASLDPKDPSETCQYCDFHAVCRIKEVNNS